MIVETSLTPRVRQNLALARFLDERPKADDVDAVAINDRRTWIAVREGCKVETFSRASPGERWSMASLIIHESEADAEAAMLASTGWRR